MAVILNKEGTVTAGTAVTILQVSIADCYYADIPPEGCAKLLGLNLKQVEDEYICIEEQDEREYAAYCEEREEEDWAAFCTQQPSRTLDEQMDEDLPF